MTAAFDWLFRNRRTGGITIGQWPNVPLWIFIVASVALRLLRPEGDVGRALAVVATMALVWWSFDEVVRGVNPFRRMLGGAVLAGIIYRLVTEGF